MQKKYLRKIIKKIILEQYSEDNVSLLNIYNVIFHTSDSSDNLYQDTNYLKAKEYYDSYNISDVEDDLKTRDDITIEFSKQTFKYKFVLEDENKENYPIEDYYDNENIYIHVKDEEYEILDTKSIENINKKSDNILDVVENYFFKKYGKYKYNIINIYDEDNNHKGCIKLRISDHTENIFNIDRFEKCDFNISVVISNLDKTERRFFYNQFERLDNEIELKYNSNTSYDNIIDDVNEKIKNCTDILLEK